MAEKIVNEIARVQFEKDYKRYGHYIFYKRVLTDYRDGLKPVQRRILWAMYKNTKAITTKVKSSAVVGDVMKAYHPHGDCMHESTMLYCLDNSFITIGDAYKMGIKELNILAVDPTTGNIVPAIATNFRIGQYTNKEYRVHLSNGAVIRCTSNHPFMLSDGTWVKAEDLISGSRLYYAKMSTDNNNRLLINNEYIHEIVHDHYYGKPANGFERHHKDFNYLNNSPDNIIALTKADHINIHKGSKEALYGLKLGRERMFADGSDIRDRIRNKNSILATQFNKDQGIRRFKCVINKMISNGMEITEENYESFRGSVYNLPTVSHLLSAHPEYGKSFNDLVNMNIVSLSELYEGSKEENLSNSKQTVINPIEYLYEHKSAIYKVFDRMLMSGIDITIDNYYNFARSNVDECKINKLIYFYRIERPYVDFVDVLEVKDQPMYDFTVNGYENMLIPVKTNMNDQITNFIGFNIPFISIHNSSVYDAMKPMVNWFEMNMPLIEGHGNFGTFQGDGAAAPRYTECKLSKFALENVLGDLIECNEAVDWSPTYSGDSVEPDYLPVKFPMLLVNGSFGIGLGTRADIPAHNLVEVINATLMLMDNPNADVVLVPDHCMPCEIINTDFDKISRSGFGHYKIRGKIDIEKYNGKTALVIKSIPNLTYLERITEKIEALIKSKKLIQIENCFDESTVSDMRYVIVLKNGSDPNYVRDVLYKNTDLEQTLRINLETLNGLKPLRLSYKSYLLSFIDFRKITKFRVYTNRLQAIQTKIHEKEAYIRVLESGEIDNIINIIKKQKTVDDGYLIEYLVKTLKITDLQAQYIIGADLKKLSYGYLKKYKEEAKELEAAKKEVIHHIMDDKVIENDIRQELIDIRNKYGRPRNCKIIDPSDAGGIPKGLMTIGITEKNFIRKVPAGIIPVRKNSLGSFRNDSLRTCITIDNTDSILIFDDMGKVFKLPVHVIPFTDKNSSGIDIRFLIKQLTANINNIIPESIFKNLCGKGAHNNKHYIVTLTNTGLIKRMDLDDFVNVPPSGIIYAKMDKGDFIKDIVIAHSNFNVIVYSDRKGVSIPVVNIPYLKRNTKGSKSMSNVDHVDGLCVVHNNCTDIVTITESGRMNRIGVVQGLPNISKGKSGSNLIKLSSNDKIVSVVSGNISDVIHVKCMDSDMQVKIENLKIGSSISTGDKVITTRGNKIIRCWIEMNQ